MEEPVVHDDEEECFLGHAGCGVVLTGSSVMLLISTTTQLLISPESWGTENSWAHQMKLEDMLVDCIYLRHFLPNNTIHVLLQSLFRDNVLCLRQLIK